MRACDLGIAIACSWLFALMGCYQSPGALTDEAEEALRNYQLDIAEERFLKALEKDPTMPRALYGLGWIAFSQGDRERARAHFERCMRMDPMFYGCHRGIGSLHLSMGYYVQAEASLQQALTLKPGDASVLGSLAQLFLLTERPAEAERAFTEALAAAPDRSELRFGLAELRYQQRRLDEALKLLDEIVQHPIAEVKFKELSLELRAQVLMAKAFEMKNSGAAGAGTQADALYAQALVAVDEAISVSVLGDRHRLHRLRKRIEQARGGGGVPP